jgi:hypothetical protein
MKRLTTDDLVLIAAAVIGVVGAALGLLWGGAP